MSVKFTLGPWRRGEWHSGGLIDIKAEDVIVAQVRLCGLPHQEGVVQEACANADLIASAPELRAALLECVAIVEAAGLLNLSNGVQLGATSWYVKASDRFDAARALLARFEGADVDAR